MAEVLVAMSGGVDSSVAAALLLDAGHDVTGVTLKLWGGDSDSGCCSVSDVDDARRVANRLGIEHHVFNFADEFDRHVVEPYVTDHMAGRTPNPCIECNRHIKFDRLLERAEVLGFDLLATGHHAAIERSATNPGELRLARGADSAKDQSYVLYMLGQAQLRRLSLPVGAMTKEEVRARAAELDLPTATKPDSQDVCFIHSDGGRRAFLGDRIPLTSARIVDTEGTELGRTDAAQLVTVGQRKGLGLAGNEQRHYVVDVDLTAGLVRVGPEEQTLTGETLVADVVWAGEPSPGHRLVQCAAHGRAVPAEVLPGPEGGATVRWERPHRRVAAGQSVVFYDGNQVLGGGVARPDPAG